MYRTIYVRLLITALLPFLSLMLYADTGGPLSSNQSAYDVKYYKLDLSILPESQEIDGSLVCLAEIINSIDTLELDLDSAFIVESTSLKLNEGEYLDVPFVHHNGKLFITIEEEVIENDMVSVQVFYQGVPRDANDHSNPGGFLWEESENGEPWIGLYCERSGADVWWPCKDHPSDEPDSVSMSFTVPNPLFCASNGCFLGSTDNGDNTTTYNWFVSTPINNYNITFYAADYMLIEESYQSVSGDPVEFYFWVLPEVYEQAVEYMDVFRAEFDFLESICGPFPFISEKHGWAYAPYWGMEHQTIIAYGSDFELSGGLDYIHYHELAHEWWGNLVTAENWADVWIHEGLATYMEALYVEHISGIDAYFNYVKGWNVFEGSIFPLAPDEELTLIEGFDCNPYFRGAKVIHTLRYHLGDDQFFNLLARWAYPDPDNFDNSNGQQCRLMSTEDMKVQAEEVTGLDLEPFFEVYFRQAPLPQLIVDRESEVSYFSWQTENNILLDVNIPVTVNGEEQVVEINDGHGVLNISSDDVLDVDPNNWVLMQNPIVTSVAYSKQVDAYQIKNYPNPFERSTTIKISIPVAQSISLVVYDQLGNEIANVASGYFEAGDHEFKFDRNGLPGGIYFHRLNTSNHTLYGKMILLD